MKKLLVFVAIVAIFFTSCKKEEEITSIVGTTWMQRWEFNGSDQSGWLECRLVFTDTHVTYTETTSSNNNCSLTGTYTFDPPTVKITVTSDDPYLAGIINAGTVKKKTMFINRYETNDVILELELKKQ